MQFLLPLALIVLHGGLLCRAVTSPRSVSEAAAELAAGLTGACSDGVRETVRLEVRSAHNQSVQDIIRGQREIDASLRQIQDHLTSLQPAPEECPGGWSRHRDSCYFISPQKTTWYLAHHVCAVLDRRARLASVHPASSQFVETLAKETGTNRIWIGLARQCDDDDSWVWSDGTPLDFADWAPSQPNNVGGNQDCVHMEDTPDPGKKLWHDNECKQKFSVMCQLHLA